MRVAWVSGLAALLLFLALAIYLRPLQPDVLALQLAFTPHRFGEIVHAWPPEHLARYRAQLPVDFVLLVCYGTFGHRLAMHWAPMAGHGVRRGSRLARWLLPAAALCDAAENSLHLWLTEAPRFGVPWAYATSATCATLKWALIVAFAMAVAWALLRKPA